MIRSAILLFTMTGLLIASSDSGTTTLRPIDPAKLSPEQFEELFSEAFAQGPELDMRLGEPQIISRACAIPLLELKVNPHRFTMRRLPVSSNDPIGVKPPFLECER